MNVTKKEAVETILKSKGRFFGLKLDGEVINAKIPHILLSRVDEDKMFGYITIIDRNNKKRRRIDTRKVEEVTINKIVYSVGDKK